jgi:hypothetical protein
VDWCALEIVTLLVPPQIACPSVQVDGLVGLADSRNELIVHVAVLLFHVMSLWTLSPGVQRAFRILLGSASHALLCNSMWCPGMSYYKLFAAPFLQVPMEMWYQHECSHKRPHACKPAGDAAKLSKSLCLTRSRWSRISIEPSQMI